MLVLRTNSQIEGSHIIYIHRSLQLLGFDQIKYFIYQVLHEEL